MQVVLETSIVITEQYVAMTKEVEYNFLKMLSSKFLYISVTLSAQEKYFL